MHKVIDATMRVRIAEVLALGDKPGNRDLLAKDAASMAPEHMYANYANCISEMFAGLTLHVFMTTDDHPHIRQIESLGRIQDDFESLHV